MKISRILAIGFALILALGCEREGDINPNGNPDTKIVVDAINLTGEDRLNSVVTLSWMGTDVDGYILGYEVSLDATTWSFTTSTDSTFRFTLNAGTDTTDIDLYIRAVDNAQNRDESPAYLKIPLKNTPPVALFDGESFPEDTAHLVTTFRWSATDSDGDESIIEAQLKINDGDWFQIDQNVTLISIAPTNPDNAGEVTANVYYNNSLTPIDSTINGLRLNDTNTFYIKVKDLALSESEIDTSIAIFVKAKSSDLLAINGLGNSDAYKTALANVYPGYDYLDYYKDDGINQPKFWTPTFNLMIGYYDKLVFYGDGTLFNNPITTLESMIISSASSALQDFSTAGGKSLIINSFNSSSDITSITGVLPFDSLSTSSGQAIFQTDSAMVAVYEPANYPNLNPNSIILAMDPFYETADATVMYTGQLEPTGPWVGPLTLGAGRFNTNNNLYQVFFSAQISQFGTEAERETLFNQILNNEFNW